jgi:hypothetical protein
MSSFKYLTDSKIKKVKETSKMTNETNNRQAEINAFKLGYKKGKESQAVKIKELEREKATLTNVLKSLKTLTQSKIEESKKLQNEIDARKKVTYNKPLRYLIQDKDLDEKTLGIIQSLKCFDNLDSRNEESEQLDVNCVIESLINVIDNLTALDSVTGRGQNKHSYISLLTDIKLNRDIENYTPERSPRKVKNENINLKQVKEFYEQENNHRLF